LPAILAAGADPGGTVPAELAPPRHWPAEIDVVPGPRRDWFDAAAWQTLTSVRWRVSAATSRVGARLEGPALVRRREGELPSEGLVGGAVQVPADGQPIVMLADHPVTGGYPVIAVVRGDHLDRVAQAPPGAMLSFRTGRP
jgi:allophanate hydrolase subunit 2